MARIVQRQIKQLEGPFECATRQLFVSSRPTDGAAHFAADVSELLRQGELPPTSTGEIAMLDLAHRRTSRLTRAVMASRVAASSTPRDRLPDDGRRLITPASGVFTLTRGMPYMYTPQQ